MLCCELRQCCGHRLLPCCITRRGQRGAAVLVLSCFTRVDFTLTRLFLCRVKSRISLVDPDPASKPSSKEEIAATSDSSVVTLVPGRLTPPKEEL